AATGPPNTSRYQRPVGHRPTLPHRRTTGWCCALLPAPATTAPHRLPHGPIAGVAGNTVRPLHPHTPVRHPATSPVRWPIRKTPDPTPSAPLGRPTASAPASPVPVAARPPRSGR